MKRRLHDLYHNLAAYVIFTRVFFTDARCPACQWHDDINVSVRCEKHYDKQFTREGRAYDHFDQANPV